MDQASFKNIIQTIIIILFAYYFIKFMMRLLAPYLMKKAMNKIQSNFEKKAQDFYNQSQGGYQNQDFNSTQKDTHSNGTLKEKKKVGEYIDYEEID